MGTRKERYSKGVISKADLVNRLLYKFGFQISKTTSRSSILDFRKMLIPVDNGFELIRAGSNSDGGYLVPNDFIGISKLISGGCDAEWSFEKFFLDNHNVESIIVDRIEKKPTKLSPRVEYIDAWIGEGANQGFISLASILENLPRNREPDLILQLDIEGAEFSELQRITENDLKRFRIVIVEFHGLERAINREYFKSVISPVFRKMLKHFDLVHSHANNCCGAISVYGVTIPRVMELTFHSVSRRSDTCKNRQIPHELDVPNDPSKPDVNWARKGV